MIFNPFHRFTQVEWQTCDEYYPLPTYVENSTSEESFAWMDVIIHTLDVANLLRL